MEKEGRRGGEGGREEEEEKKKVKREDVSTQVPGVGFQVAGRSVRPVSPEQTALLNREMAGRREGWRDGGRVGGGGS